MKALVLEKNNSFKIKDIKTKKLKPNECKIKIKSVGICSSDIQRSLNNGAYNYPLIMGHEISGIVIEIGKNVKIIKKNNKVSIYPLIPCKICIECQNENYQLCYKYKYYGSRNDGGFSEYIVANEWNLIKINKNITYENASLIEPIAVVVSAINKLIINKPKNNAKLLIIGGGFLGLIALKILRQKYEKLQLSIIDKNNYKIKVAKKITKYAFRHDNYELSKKKYDYILEATGETESIKKSINLANNNSTIIWMGNVNKDIKLQKKDIMKIIRNEITIKGTWNSKFKNSKNDDWKETIKLLKNGLDIKDIITHILKLEQIPMFLNKMKDHKNKIKKFNYIKGIVRI